MLLDNVIVFNTSMRKHIKKLREVFELEKLEFLRKELFYLGYIVTSKGVKNPEQLLLKIHKIFAKLTKPFTKYLKNNAIIYVNDPEYINCVEICKNLLKNEPILRYPDFTKPFLATDQLVLISVVSKNSSNK